jgi:predicted DsbA family dithiol-disulfide isomerase
VAIDTPVRLQVFFDYTCPWVRQTGLWLYSVKDAIGDDLQLEWRPFLLEQVNSKEGPDWKAWEQDDQYVSRGIWPHRGGIAARAQGEEAHRRYACAIWEAKHVERMDVRSRESVVDVARDAGLDMTQFEIDADDPGTLLRIGEEHEAAARQGVFGTPTMVFEDRSSAYLKMYAPPESESVEMFEHFLGLARFRMNFGELKRPQPPWPQGYEG